jgi:hypothetical protein
MIGTPLNRRHFLKASAVTGGTLLARTSAALAESPPASVAFRPGVPLAFRAAGRPGSRRLTLRLPEGCEGELVLPRGEPVDLAPAPGSAPTGCLRYRVPAAGATTLNLQFT